jgi:hypothetical protein
VRPLPPSRSSSSATSEIAWPLLNTWPADRNSLEIVRRVKALNAIAANSPWEFST